MPLLNLGQVALARDDLDAAAASFLEALDLAVGHGLSVVPQCVNGLAAVAGGRGEGHQAAVLFGAAEAGFARVGVRAHAVDRPQPARFRSAVRGLLGDAAFDRLQAAGARLAPAEAFDAARAVAGTSGPVAAP